MADTHDYTRPPAHDHGHDHEQTESGVSFPAFVMSLAHTAAVHFGDVADPGTGSKGTPDLFAARQMIDILSMLEAKTRGNLTAEERQLVEQLLHELRVRFVEAAKAAAPSTRP